MFGIGGFELFLIVLFAFMLFGPEKIPVFLKTLRKAVAKFREAEQEVSAALKQEVVDPETGETAADVLDSLTGKSTSSSRERTAASESFAERKARHDREKAEREKREREKAAVEASVEEASEASPEKGDDAPAAVAASAISGVSIDELYTMKPVEAANVEVEDVADAGDDQADDLAAKPEGLIEVVEDDGEEA